ncbi:PREDICTED: B3 domain-containing transcription factor VRN1-like isoform X2 [Prunus mume]|uniref:B3 domain-containing transcription factor VRN1-like isoform X2 n=1 Tax=Prunus mume TaxID=102107 RepID=A0ABM1LVQ5_PRUMU|nr:PREDICTED: B3 domain-containing transcription factor VRN1-like isoform X2 [Prunus mume]
MASLHDSPASIPHFLRIILDKTSKKTRIKIPMKFLTRYGENLSSPVHLKLPSGLEMEIELRRSNDGWVWFDKGWPEFSKLCSLDYEIEYPKPEMEETDSDSEEDDDDDDDDESGHARGEIKRENDMPTKKDFGGSSSSRIFLGRMHPLTKSEKALALQRANAFESEYPSFLVAIQPVYIHRGYLHLPSEFARRHLVKQRARNIILKILDGRTWVVEFKYETSITRFQRGWLAFARDNNLKVGDVCVFVLIDCNERLFEVFFYRTNNAEDCPLSPGHGGVAIDRVEKRRNPMIKVETDCTTNYENGKYKRLKTGGQVTQRPLNSSSRSLEAANRFTPKNPSFRATLGSTPLILHVPVTFARSFVKKRKQTVNLQVRERSWPVNLIGHTKESGAKLCGGWREFVTENCLMEGDVCIFELIERNDIVLKVHIFRC